VAVSSVFGAFFFYKFLPSSGTATSSNLDLNLNPNFNRLLLPEIRYFRCFAPSPLL
jgi:hypothetical protein